MKTKQEYINWMKENNFNLSSDIDIDYIPSSHSYGVIAKKNLPKYHVLFQIPRNCLLHPSTVPEISELLKNEEQFLKPCKNRWIGLLLSILHEKCKGSDSKWSIYLNSVPNFQGLENPLFWSENELHSNLSGTGLIEDVQKDKVKISNDFHTFVLPLIKKYTHLFPNKSLHTLKEYELLVAFVMAYSFTEPKTKDEEEDKETDDDENEEEEEKEENNTESIMMIPMADMLNHHTKHNSQLFFDEHPDYLLMKTICEVEKNSELFNTYGSDLSNAHLLRMHGFALVPDENDQDIVELQFSKGFQENKRWEKLINTKPRPSVVRAIIDEDEEDDLIVAFDKHGFLNAEELARALTVMLMSDEEFDNWWERHGHNFNEDGMSEDEEDDCENIEKYTFYLSSMNTIRKLPTPWKAALRRICAWKLQDDYQTDIETDQEYLNNLTKNSSSNNKLRFSLFVRIGQKRVLKQLIEQLLISK